MLSTGKAVGLSLGGLVAGALLGTVVANWLRVDIVPLGVRLGRGSAIMGRKLRANGLRCSVVSHPPPSTLTAQGFSSPGVLCTEFAITTLLLGSLFLV